MPVITTDVVLADKRKFQIFVFVFPNYKSFTDKFGTLWRKIISESNVPVTLGIKFDIFKNI